MRLYPKFSILNMILSFICMGCVNLDATALAYTPTPLPSQHGLNIVLESKSIAIWATEADRQTARDIFSAIEANAEQICTTLQTECQFPLLIEIHPDQASFDEYVINPEMRGYFAISGPPHTIQMVSPANPAPHTISYEDAVLVAVHEFTHLALDEVNAGMPTWLDEGTAIYVGPHQLYTNACQNAFPFQLTPSFQDLVQNYDKIQAPDLFAYTVVDFIVSQYGMDKLNQLLRTPEKLQTILGVSEETFEDNWLDFIRSRYSNHQTKVFSNS
jgi:hypothetical protein